MIVQWIAYLYKEIIFKLNEGQPNYSKKFNIINEHEIKSFIERLKNARPAQALYIDKKIVKYLKTDSYIVESKSYSLNLLIKILLKVADNKEKSIYKKHGFLGKYHVVYCTEGLFSRILKILDFHQHRSDLNLIPFRELVYDYQYQTTIIPNLNKLILGKDYKVVLKFSKYEVWQLLTVLAYKHEGILMKNCLGKFLFPERGQEILSFRPIKSLDKPVMTVRIDSAFKNILEAKEKVNKPVVEYLFLIENLCESLNINKDQFNRDV